MKLSGPGLSRFIAGMLLLIVISGCGGPSDSWDQHLPGLCSFSSPRPADLNGDGVLRSNYWRRAC